MKERNKNGFSLIELIVVITIISVITVVGIVSFTGAQKKARDSRRMSDVEKIRIALEMARQVGSTYPANLDVLVNKGWLQVVPKDPKGYGVYPYAPNGTGYAYSLYSYMEDIGSSNFAGDGTACGSAGTCNYKVVNP